MNSLQQLFCSLKGYSFDTFSKNLPLNEGTQKEYIEWLENELEQAYTPIKITPEPILIQPGDDRVRLGYNGTPPRVACRVISEEVYQILINRGKN